MDPSTDLHSRPAQHTRSKSSFSVTSKTSDKSDSKRPKITAREAQEAEKRHKHRFSTERTADPNMAVREVEPGQRAVLEAVTLAPIRNMQWKDVYGNPISDPDASNPTRSRMERPLDTIRSFEAAIEGSSRRRDPRVARGEAAENGNNYSSRRSSFVGNDPAVNPRAPLSRTGRQSSYGGDYYQGAHRPAHPRYSHGPPARMYSETNLYPVHGYHDSYETVGTGESYGSHTTEPSGNSTDPSSENSSIDRMQRAAGKQPSLHDAYEQPDAHPPPRSRQSPANVSPERRGYPAPASPFRQQGQGNAYKPSGPSVPEHSAAGAPRKVIQLGNAGAPDAAAAAAPPAPPAHASLPQAQPPRPSALQKQPSEKRKSWLKRRFSKG